MSNPILAAECRENKHPYCQGKAWDPVADELGECLCECHAGEESQEQPLQVTVYVKKETPGDPCRQCDMTTKAMDAAGITYQTIVVDPEKDKAHTDEMKYQANQLGVQASFPYVLATGPSPEDEIAWFGFQPQKIKELKGRRSA